MLNPKTAQVAQMIAEQFQFMTVDRDGNTLTLEDGAGDRYLVTVEAMYTLTNLDTPLPDPGA